MKGEQDKPVSHKPKPPSFPPKLGQFYRKMTWNSIHGISQQEGQVQNNNSQKKEEKSLSIEERNRQLLDQLFEKHPAEEILSSGFKDNIVSWYPVTLIGLLHTQN